MPTGNHAIAQDSIDYRDVFFIISLALEKSSECAQTDACEGSDFCYKNDNTQGNTTNELLLATESTTLISEPESLLRPEKCESSVHEENDQQVPESGQAPSSYTIDEPKEIDLHCNENTGTSTLPEARLAEVKQVVVYTTANIGRRHRKRRRQNQTPFEHPGSVPIQQENTTIVQSMKRDFVHEKEERISHSAGRVISYADDTGSVGSIWMRLYFAGQASKRDQIFRIDHSNANDDCGSNCSGENFPVKLLAVDADFKNQRGVAGGSEWQREFGWRRFEIECALSGHIMELEPQQPQPQPQPHPEEFACTLVVRHPAVVAVSGLLCVRPPDLLFVPAPDVHTDAVTRAAYSLRIALADVVSITKSRTALLLPVPSSVSVRTATAAVEYRMLA
ncbi:hypothetical protein HDU84_007455 [Entophlyctis sp. JEL0112]|nr:hypothetical protein HDU84_007455 [Entophlyctis sp. JEL0112]